MSLVPPILLMLALSVAIAILTARLGTGLSSKKTVAIGTGLAGSLVLFILALRGQAFWLVLLPVSDAVIYAELTPVLGAALIGLAWSQIPGGRLRKLTTLLPMSIVTLWLSYGTLLRPTPHCHDSWNDGVCLQTSESSCSAACAATLLRYHGLPATEHELAILCLTYDPRGREPGGTTLHGLYRGLKRKISGSNLAVDVHQGTVDDLLSKDSGPWIISVGLSDRQASDPIYQEQYGWSPGMRHSVVLYRQVSADRIEIGDPSVGREQWSVDDLRVLWRGAAIRLRKR